MARNGTRAESEPKPEAANVTARAIFRFDLLQLDVSTGHGLVVREHRMAKSSGTGWRQKSNGFLASIAAVALIVVLLGGMAIGYEIEKGRVKPATTTAAQRRTATLRAAAAKKAKAAKAKKGKVVGFRVVGTVSKSATGSITVTPKKGAARKMSVAKSTVIEKSSSGAASDIATNHKVVFSGAGSLTKAKDVIILPKSSRMGVLISSADGTSMSLKNGKKTTKVTTTGATVDTTSPGKIGDVPKGTKVMVSGVRTAAGVMTAVEIIVLPSGSAFA